MVLEVNFVATLNFQYCPHSMRKKEGEILHSKGIYGSDDNLKQRMLSTKGKHIQESMRLEHFVEMNILTHPCCFVEALHD